MLLLKKNAFLIVLCCLSAFSCSRQSRKDSAKGPTDSNKSDPNGEGSKEAALALLSDSDRQTFEAWQKRMSKDCVAQSIFNEQAAVSIDTEILSQNLGRSSLVNLDGGGWALVEPGFPSYPESSTAYSVEQQLNGVNVRSIDVKTTQGRNGLCEVFIKDQSVAKFTLVPNVRVQTFVTEKFTPIQDEALFQKLNSKRVYLNGTLGNATRLAGPWSQFISLALQNVNSDQIESVSQNLGLDPSRILLGNKTSFHAETADQSLSSMGPGAEDILLNASEMPESWQQKASELTFTLITRTPEWNSSHPSSLWSWSANLKSTIIPNQQLLGEFMVTQMSLSSQAAPTPVLADDESFIQCLDRRLSFTGLSAAVLPQGRSSSIGVTTISPNQSDAIGTCDLFLASEVSQALFDYKRDALQDVLRAVDPQSLFEGGGWTDTLRDWIAQVFQKDGVEGVKTQLDPQVPIVAKFVRVSALVESSLNTLNERALESDSLEKIRSWARNQALNWSFSSREPLSQAILDSVYFTAARLFSSLEVTVRNLMQEIESDPLSLPQNIESLSNIEDSLLARISEYRQKLQALGVSELFTERVKDYRSFPVTSEQLSVWEQTISVAQELRARNIKESANPASENSSALSEYVKRALTENWSQGNVNDFFNLAKLAEKKSSCQSRERDKSPAEALECAEIFSSVSTGNKKLLDPLFQGRYPNAALVFVSAYETLEPANDSFYLSGSLRLLEDFWSPVWESCSNDAFSERLAKLKPLVDQISEAAGDLFSRSQLERSLRDLLRDCSSF